MQPIIFGLVPYARQHTLISLFVAEKAFDEYKHKHRHRHTFGSPFRTWSLLALTKNNLYMHCSLADDDNLYVTCQNFVRQRILLICMHNPIYTEHVHYYCLYYLSHMNETNTRPTPNITPQMA